MALLWPDSVLDQRVMQLVLYHPVSLAYYEAFVVGNLH